VEEEEEKEEERCGKDLRKKKRYMENRGRYGEIDEDVEMENEEES
jgi:hypothetical protein